MGIFLEKIESLDLEYLHKNSAVAPDARAGLFVLSGRRRVSPPSLLKSPLYLYDHHFTPPPVPVHTPLHSVCWQPQHHRFLVQDCWAARERNASGYPYPDVARFPDGLKPVIDYVHSKGEDGDRLAFGLYTCGGTKTCVGARVGSEGHWAQDAQAYAEWGVDW